MVKGHHIHLCLIDDSCSLNIISEATCHHLGITQWESCPFCLRMADTRFVCPLGLIRHLDFILGGHTFTISAVVLRLHALGAYPILLR